MFYRALQGHRLDRQDMPDFLEQHHSGFSGIAGGEVFLEDADRNFGGDLSEQFLSVSFPHLDDAGAEDDKAGPGRLQ